MASETTARSTFRRPCRRCSRCPARPARAARAAVLERGAVEGEIFHRGAVQALAPTRRQVTPRLAALVRKELIRPDRAQFPGDDGFRFRHLLIRDAAYDALAEEPSAPTCTSASPTGSRTRPGLVELDELLGYHLEQAARYLDELGQESRSSPSLPDYRLGAAGRRAFWRGDWRTAAALLERALSLTRPYRLDLRAGARACTALYWTDATTGGRGCRRCRRTRHSSGGRGRRGTRTHGRRAGANACRPSARPTRSSGSPGGAAAARSRQGRRRPRPCLVRARLGRQRSSTPRGLGPGSRNGNAARPPRRPSGLNGVHDDARGGAGGWAAAGERGAGDLDAALADQPSPSGSWLAGMLLAMLDRIDEAWEVALPAEERLGEFGTTGPTNGSARSR